MIHSTANEDAIAASALTLPAIADRHLVSLQAETLKLVDAHAKNLEATVNGAVRTADNRLASIQDDAKGQLGELNQTVALTAKALPPALGELNHSIASVSADVHQVAVPIAGTAAQLNDAAPLYLDCDSGNCLFNHIQGTSRAIDQTMVAIAKAAPQMAESAVSIEGSVAGIAANGRRETDILMRPKKWWQRALGYLNLAAIAAAHAI